MVHTKEKPSQLNEHDKKLVKKIKITLLVVVVFVVIPVMLYLVALKPLMRHFEAANNPYSINNSKVVSIITEVEEPEYEAINSSLLSVAKDATDDNIVTEKEYDAVMVEYEYFIKKSTQ